MPVSWTCCIRMQFRCCASIGSTQSAKNGKKVRVGSAVRMRLFREQRMFISVFNQYTALSNDHQTWLRAEFCRQPNANESAGTDDNIRTVETLKGRYRRMMEELRHRMIAASINYNEWALIAGMIIFIAALFFSIRACRKTVMRDLRTRNAAGRRCQLLLVGCLLHSVSFASSSFIEEEHFTWYFLFSTYLFVLLFDVFDAGLKTNSLFVWGKTLFCCVGILSFRLIRHWNPAGIKWRELESVSDWLTK